MEYEETPFGTKICGLAKAINDLSKKKCGDCESFETKLERMKDYIKWVANYPVDPYNESCIQNIISKAKQILLEVKNERLPNKNL